MDPVTALGAAGSIVGIVAFGLQLAGYLYKVQSKVRGARESLKNILASIKSTASALESLYTYIKLEREGIRKRRGRLQIFSLDALIDLKDTADQCLIIFWRIEATITGNKNSASDEELARKLVQFNKLLSKDVAPQVSLDNTIGDASWNLIASLRWTYIDFKLDGYSQQLQHHQGSLTLMCSVVSLGELRTIGTHLRSNDHFRTIAEAYQNLLSHKDIVIIAAEFSRRKATQNYQSPNRQSRSHRTGERSSKMESKSTAYPPSNVDTSSKHHDRRPSDDVPVQPTQQPVEDEPNTGENGAIGPPNPLHSQGEESREERPEPVVHLDGNPNVEARTTASSNIGVPTLAAVENVPNLDGNLAASLSPTKPMQVHRESFTGDGGVTVGVGERGVTVEVSTQRHDNRKPPSGVREEPDFHTVDPGHSEKEPHTHDWPNGLEGHTSAVKEIEPQRRDSYPKTLKAREDSTKLGSAKFIETPNDNSKPKEWNRSRTLVTPNKSFEETNRVLIAAYKIAAGSAHLVPLYRHHSPWVPKGPWRPNGRRQVSIWWRSQFRVAHKSFLKTFSTMTKEDLDALEQILQDHGNGDSYPFLVDLKRISGGWYFKSWTKNDCPVYLAVVEEHYYVKEDPETSVLRATLRQNERAKPSSTPEAGASRPKSDLLNRNLIQRRPSRSLTRNLSHQDIMQERGIQDVSDMLRLDEDSEDEDSLYSREYRIFSIQPLTNDPSNWVRCTVREEPLGTNDILQRIEDLDSDKVSVLDKKLQLRSDQQAQLTRIHSNIVSNETDPGMCWLLRQLQVVQKDTSLFRKRSPASGILVIFVREPRPGLEHEFPSHARSRRYSPSVTTVAAANAVENRLSKPMEEAPYFPVQSVSGPPQVPKKEARSPSIRSFEKKTEVGKNTVVPKRDEIDVIAVDVEPEEKDESSEILDISGSRKATPKPSRADKGNTPRGALKSRASTTPAGDRIVGSRNLPSQSRSRIPSPARSYDQSLSRLRYEAYSAGRKDQEKEDEKEERLALQRYYERGESRHQLERRDDWQTDPLEQTLNDEMPRSLRGTTYGSQLQYFDNDVRQQIREILALKHRQGKAAKRLEKSRTESEEKEARLELNMITTLLREAKETLTILLRENTLVRTDEELAAAAADTLASRELESSLQATYPTYFDRGRFDPLARSPSAKDYAIDQLLLKWTPLNDAVDGSINAVPEESDPGEISEQSELEQEDEAVLDIHELSLLLPESRGGESEVGSLDDHVLETENRRSYVQAAAEGAADLEPGSDAAITKSAEDNSSPQVDTTHKDVDTDTKPIVADNHSPQRHKMLAVDNSDAGSESAQHQNKSETNCIDKSRKESGTMARARQESVTQPPSPARAQDHLDRARRLVRSTAIRSDPGDFGEERKLPEGDDDDGIGRPGGFRLPRKSRTWDTREPYDLDTRIAFAEKQDATRSKSEVALGTERRNNGGALYMGNTKKLRALSEANRRILSRHKEEDESDLGARRDFRQDLKPRSRASPSVRWEDRDESMKNVLEEARRNSLERNYREAVDARRRRQAAEQDEMLARRAREEQIEHERRRRELSELRFERKMLEDAYAEADERERGARARRGREKAGRAKSLDPRLGF